MRESWAEALAEYKQTPLDDFLQGELGKTALKFAKEIQQLFPGDVNAPTWNWWQQLNRSSMSIYYNAAEFHARRHILCNKTARGEAFESVAALTIGPPECEALLPTARRLVTLVEQQLAEAAGVEFQHE